MQRLLDVRPTCLLFIIQHAVDNAFLKQQYLGTCVSLVISDKSQRGLLAYGRFIFSHFQVYIQIEVLQIAHNYYDLFMYMVKDTVICIL